MSSRPSFADIFACSLCSYRCTTWECVLPHRFVLLGLLHCILLCLASFADCNVCAVYLRTWSIHFPCWMVVHWVNRLWFTYWLRCWWTFGLLAVWSLSQSAHTAIANYYRLGGLNNRNLCCIILQAVSLDQSASTVELWWGLPTYVRPCLFYTLSNVFRRRVCEGAYL